MSWRVEGKCKKWNICVAVFLKGLLCQCRFTGDDGTAWSEAEQGPLHLAALRITNSQRDSTWKSGPWTVRHQKRDGRGPAGDAAASQTPAWSQPVCRVSQSPSRATGAKTASKQILRQFYIRRGIFLQHPKRNLISSRWTIICFHMLGQRASLETSKSFLN